MKNSKNILGKVFAAEYSLFWLIAAVFIFFSIAEPAFASFSNMMNILKTASIMALMVAGMTWVIAANEMDAAFPDVAAGSSMVFAMCIFSGYNLVLSIVISLIAGIACGAIISLLVVKFKYHSLITTIAISTVAKSVASAINEGMPLTATGIQSSPITHFINADLFGVPVIFIITLLIYIGLLFIQERTKFGQYIYALGENRQGVEESGVKTNKILTIIFIASSFFAALAGVMLVLIVYGSGQPRIGSSFFLDGFTVVFLGAMVLKLGKTNVVGTFLGAIMLTMIVNGLAMMGSNFAVNQIVKGVLLVIGIAVVALSQRRKRGKIGVLKYE